jgi:hypothetical protein
MSIKNIYRTYIKSWDFAISIAVSVILFIILPTYIKGVSATSFYNVGITVLSIIFSLFFASLAIIMSSTDNEFIMYLEENNLFTEIMETFKFVLVLLFISLIYSIVLYSTTDYYIKQHGELISFHHKGLFILFQFLFTYSLIGTALSVGDTISFTTYRTKFLITKKAKEDASNRNAETTPP